MRETLLCLALIASSAAAMAQTPSAPSAAAPAPAIRRWLDVQQVSAGSRFRWYKNSQEQLRSSNLQWQTQLRGRFLFDKEARYSVNAFASTGATFPSSWNNTGGGMGTYQGPFNVKQLFLAAEPVKGLQFEVGGLHLNRGEMAEHLTYDNDAYIVGERATYRPAKGAVTQVSVTGAFFGDYNDVNVFKRFERLDEWNYGQALVAFRLHKNVTASADYTYEAARDIVREGVNFRMPTKVKVLTALKVEAYQRVSEPHDGYGFNVSGDLRWKKLSVTAGVMSVDQYYGTPTFQPYNGDRYESGTREYTIATYQITPELAFTVYQTEAFATDYPINLQHRFDALVNFNATNLLKRARVF